MFARVKHRVALSLLLLVAGCAYSQAPRRPPRPALRVLSSQGNLAVSFEPVASGAPLSAGPSGQGNLQVGTVSAAGASLTHGVHVERRADTMVVETQFGIRLGATIGAGADARLSAFLIGSGNNCRYRVDGVMLSDSPVAISLRVPTGKVTQHVLEIEIPASVPEGGLGSSIGFIAVLN